MTKYTDKEIYTAIVEGTFEDLDVDTIVAWAQKKIASITNKAAKAKERAAAKKAEGDELKALVLETVGPEFETIADITSRIEGEDVTVSKISYRLNALAKEGQLVKGELTLEDGKSKRKVVAYKRA